MVNPVFLFIIVNELYIHQAKFTMDADQTQETKKKKMNVVQLKDSLVKPQTIAELDVIQKWIM